MVIKVGKIVICQGLRTIIFHFISLLTARLGTNQDILDAEVALTTARNNYIQAMYDYNTNKAGVEAGMGIVVE